MKVLKAKFKRKFKKIPGGGGDKLKYEPDTVIALSRIPIKKKIGKWCKYYENRLPFPIECSSNKISPKRIIFKGKKQTITKDTPDCSTCERFPQWHSWKRGDWDKIIEAIKEGENLIDFPPPNQEVR